MVDHDQVLLQWVRKRLEHWRHRLGLPGDWQIDVSIGGWGCQLDAPGRARIGVPSSAALVEWVLLYSLLELVVLPFREWLYHTKGAELGYIRQLPVGVTKEEWTDASLVEAGDWVYDVDLFLEQMVQDLVKGFLGSQPPQSIREWWYDRNYKPPCVIEQLKERQASGELPASLRWTGPAYWPPLPGGLRCPRGGTAPGQERK